jgi:hypothetical protein
MEPVVRGVFIAGGAIAVLIIVYSVYKYVRSNMQPRLRATAKVIKTYADKTDEGKTAYFARFRLKNSTVLEFKINKKVFLSTAEGEFGELVYKSGKFIKFIKDSLEKNE